MELTEAGMAQNTEPKSVEFGGSLLTFRGPGGASILLGSSGEVDGCGEAETLHHHNPDAPVIDLEDEAASAPDGEVNNDDNNDSDGDLPYLSDTDRDRDHRATKKLSDDERRAIVRLAHGLMFQHWQYRTQKGWIIEIIRQRALESEKIHNENTVRGFLNREMLRRETEKKHEGSGRSVNSGSYYSQLDAMIEHKDRVSKKPERTEDIARAAKSVIKNDMRKRMAEKRKPGDDGRPKDSDDESEPSSSKRQHESSKRVRQNSDVVGVLKQLAKSQERSSENLAAALRERPADTDERFKRIEELIELRFQTVMDSYYTVLEKERSYPDHMAQNLQDRQDDLMEMLREIRDHQKENNRLQKPQQNE